MYGGGGGGGGGGGEGCSPPDQRHRQKAAAWPPRIQLQVVLPIRQPCQPKDCSAEGRAAELIHSHTSAVGNALARAPPDIPESGAQVRPSGRRWAGKSGADLLCHQLRARSTSCFGSWTRDQHAGAKPAAQRSRRGQTPIPDYCKGVCSRNAGARVRPTALHSCSCKTKARLWIQTRDCLTRRPS